MNIGVYWHKKVVVHVQVTEIRTVNQPKILHAGAYSRWQDAKPRKGAAAGHRHLPWHGGEPKMELEKGSQGDNSNWSDSKTALLQSKDAPLLKNEKIVH